MNKEEKIEKIAQKIDRIMGEEKFSDIKLLHLRARDYLANRIANFSIKEFIKREDYFKQSKGGE